MDFGTKLDQLRAVNLPQIKVEAIEDVKDQLLEINKEQLYDGKLSSGSDLTPSYLNDPFFKSPGSAQAYSNWKDKITPNAKRNSGTPNLFINGYFYDSISISVVKDRIEYSAAFKGSEIESKYTPKIFGLGGTYREKWIAFLEPIFIKKVRDACAL